MSISDFFDQSNWLYFHHWNHSGELHPIVVVKYILNSTSVFEWKQVWISLVRLFILFKDSYKKNCIKKFAINQTQKKIFPHKNGAISNIFA